MQSTVSNDRGWIGPAAANSSGPAKGVRRLDSAFLGVQT